MFSDLLFNVSSRSPEKSGSGESNYLFSKRFRPKAVEMTILKTFISNSRYFSKISFITGIKQIFN